MTEYGWGTKPGSKLFSRVCKRLQAPDFQAHIHQVKCSMIEEKN